MVVGGLVVVGLLDVEVVVVVVVVGGRVGSYVVDEDLASAGYFEKGGKERWNERMLVSGWYLDDGSL